MGTPNLERFWRSFNGFLAEDKLKLKDEKARKAEQSINEIFKEQLALPDPTQMRRIGETKRPAFGFLGYG